MWTRGLSVTARLSNQFLASAKPSVQLPQSGAAGRHDDAGMIPVTRQREWNRAVAHAEKLVGFPTSVFHLQVRTKGVHIYNYLQRIAFTTDFLFVSTFLRKISTYF